jgi:hypothetical protein
MAGEPQVVMASNDDRQDIDLYAEVQQRVRLPARVRLRQ